MQQSVTAPGRQSFFWTAGLALIFLIGLVIRIKAMWAPIAGDFSSYQIDNLCISKFILKEGFHGVLYPKTMTLLNGQPLLILLSFPLASWTASIFNGIFGGDIAFWGHFQGFLYSTLGLGIYFAALKCFAGRSTALLACAILWLSPLFMVYGSKFFAEASAFFFLMIAVYAALRASDSAKPAPGLWLLCGAALGIMAILRVHFVLTLPAFFYLLWLERTKGSWLATLACFFLPLGIPFLAWSHHVAAAAKEGENVYMNYHMQSQFKDRLADWASSVKLISTSHFQKIILKDFLNRHFTAVLLPFLILGFADKGKPAVHFFKIWYLTLFLLILLIPQKIYDHSFYAFAALPAGSFLIAQGLRVLANEDSSRFQLKTAAVMLGALSLALALRASLPPLFAVTAEEARAVEAGKYIDETFPSDAKVITAKAGSSPELFYYSNRLGWILDFTKRDYLKSGGIDIQRQYFSSMFQQKKENFLKMTDAGRLETYRKEGATHLAVLSPEELSKNPEFETYIRSHFKELASAKSQLAIFDLK